MSGQIKRKYDRAIWSEKSCEIFFAKSLSLDFLFVEEEFGVQLSTSHQKEGQKGLFGPPHTTLEVTYITKKINSLENQP